jgi:hypothetical protein
LLPELGPAVGVIVAATDVEIVLVAVSYVSLVAFVLLAAYRTYTSLRNEGYRYRDENTYLRDEVERLSAERGRG